MASADLETGSYECEDAMGLEMSKKSACCGGERQEIVQIDVFGETIGLIALNQIFEQLRFLGRPPDASVQDELLKMVAAKNYIPARCENEYRIALVREYARFCAQKEKRTLA
jgi:hypothetical protein